MYSASYSCHILMTLKFSGHIFEKYTNIKFHEIPFIGSRVPCGQRDGWTDRHGEVNSHFSQFFELAYKN